MAKIETKFPSQNSKFKSDELVIIYKESANATDCDCFVEEVEKKVKEKFPELKDCTFDRYKNDVFKNVELWKNFSSDVANMYREVAGQNTTNVDYIIFNHDVNGPDGAVSDNKELDLPINYELKEIDSSQLNGEEEVIIAVLDTGVNFSVIPEEYLWEGEVEGHLVKGVNFLVDDLKNENENYGRFDIEDDSLVSHGTLINAFIIEQFKGSGKRVKIMNLKTHNKDGKGNLFSAVSAIKFAKEHNAHIINASWGFYSQEDELLEPLKDLIIKALKDKGILFVAAAGNASEVDDDLYLSRVQSGIGGNNNPRDLSRHHFYPAYFGNEIQDELKCMFVVTTIMNHFKSLKISPRQNFSPDVVDLGIAADKETPENSDTADKDYKFKVPLQKTGTVSELFVLGSSFAAAIATGKIGSNFTSEFLSTNRIEKINKKNLINGKIGLGLFKKDPRLQDWINHGLYI